MSSTRVVPFDDKMTMEDPLEDDQTFLTPVVVGTTANGEGFPGGSLLSPISSRGSKKRKQSMSAIIFGFSESQMTTNVPWYFRSLHPSGRFRRVWDVVVTLLLFYCAFSIPFRVAFNAESYPGDRFYGIEVAVDVLFWIDILVNFKTAFYDHGYYIDKPREIAKSYFRFWFWIDFLSVFPFATIIYELTPDDASPPLNVTWADCSGGSTVNRTAGAASLTRMLRVIRLVRLTRMFRLKRLLSKWQRHIYINKSVERSFAFFLVMVGLAHAMACMWFYASNSHDFDENTWVYYYKEQEVREMGSNPACWEDDFDNYLDLFQWYWVALYWSITTVTTAGFGDITPRNDSERFVASLSMVVGGVAYAYIVGNIAVLVQEFDPQARILDAKVREVNSYLAKRQLPSELQYDVREHYQHTWRQEQLVADEHEIFDELSPVLQSRMTFCLNRKIFRNMPYCGDMSDSFIQSIQYRLLPCPCAANEVILEEDDPFVGLYFLSSGRVTISHNNIPITSLDFNTFFGDIALFIPPHRSTARVVAASPVELYLLSPDLLRAMFVEDPAFGERLCSIAYARHHHLITGIRDASGTLPPTDSALRLLDTAIAARESHRKQRPEKLTRSTSYLLGTAAQRSKNSSVHDRLDSQATELSVVKEHLRAIRTLLEANHRART